MIYKYLINIGNNVYPYFFSKDTQMLMKKLSEIESDKIVFVYDKTLPVDKIDTMKRLISKERESMFLGLELNEEIKMLQTVEDISEKLIGLGITRKSCLVAVGGGVLGNIVGLTAGLLFRGIKLVHIPTTVMAATDSVLSLKQAVNISKGKNLLGFFYKPCAVFTDYNMLDSLSLRDYKAGLAELIKNVLAIIPDEISTVQRIFNSKYEYTFSDFKIILELSIKAKSIVLKNDMRETKEGVVLEYGHTIGHAIEFLSKGKIKHGEGVAFGLLVEGEIGRELGYLTDKEMRIHYELVEQLGVLDIIAPDIIKIKSDKILDIIKFDNKRGYIKCNSECSSIVILRDIGKCNLYKGKFITSVPNDLIIKSIEKVYKFINFKIEQTA